MTTRRADQPNRTGHISRQRGPRPPGRMPESPPRRATGVTYQIVRELACAFPDVEEGTSHGTPALKVRGKFLARLKEDGETLAVKVDFPMREALMQAEPGTFFITDHYRDSPAVLVRLASVDRKRLHEVLEHAWRFVAPASLRKAPAGEGKGSERRRGKRK